MVSVLVHVSGCQQQALMVRPAMPKVARAPSMLQTADDDSRVALNDCQEHASCPCHLCRGWLHHEGDSWQPLLLRKNPGGLGAQCTRFCLLCCTAMGHATYTGHIPKQRCKHSQHVMHVMQAPMPSCTEFPGFDETHMCPAISQTAVDDVPAVRMTSILHICIWESKMYML